MADSTPPPRHGPAEGEPRAPASQHAEVPIMKTIPKVFGSMMLALMMAALSVADSAGTEFLRLQLGRYPTEDEARSRADVFRDLGYEVAVRPSRGTWIVTFGEYNILADAHADREVIRAELVPDSFVVREPREGVATFAPATNALPGIAPAPGAQERILNAAETAQGAKMRSRVADLLRQGRSEDAAADLRAEIENLVDGDLAKGWATMRLAYLELRDSNHELGRAFFAQVASGQVAATAREKHEALYRLGSLAQRDKDRTAAWRFFRQAYHDAADDSQRADAAMRLAAISMELARAGRGTLEDTRRFIDEQLEWVPYSERQARSRMGLMHLESYYYDGALDEFMNRVDSFIAGLDQEERTDIATALCFKGMACFQMNQFVDAFATYEKVLEMEFQPGDGWKAIPDFRGHALGWMKLMAWRLQDAELVGHYTGEMAEYEEGKSAAEVGQ